MQNFIFTIILLAVIHSTRTLNDYTNKEWDYLLFVQNWPITICIDWLSNNAKNKCTIPQPGQWTVHGIWPTKIGTEGPNNCNHTWKFDGSKIEPLLPELEQYWTNIEENTKLMSFWEHEWDKHGTCASSLEALNDEFKFFSQALAWVKQYSIGEILKQNGIVPGDKAYSVLEIHNAIKSSLNVTPVIQCFVQPHTKISLIQDIRLCFDKSLGLIDCETVENVSDYLLISYEVFGLLTNCDLRKPVRYFNDVPKEVELDYNRSMFLEKMVNLYEMIRFLMWLTL